MIGDQHIETAIAEGVLTREQAARLREIADRSAAWDAAPQPVDPDDERFRLIGGFNDVFVTIGVVLLVSALFALARALGFGVGFSIIGLVAAWGLSEVFARRMRLALPSIALALMFAGAAALIVMAIWRARRRPLASIKQKPGVQVLLFAVSALPWAAAVHERRFHVPIDAAIIAAGLVGATIWPRSSCFHPIRCASTAPCSSGFSVSSSSRWRCAWMPATPSG